MADVVLRAVREGRGQGPGGYPTVLAMEPGCGETERIGGTGPSRERGHFLDRGAQDPDERRSTTMTQIRSHPVERWTASCYALYKQVRRSFTLRSPQVLAVPPFVAEHLRRVGRGPGVPV